MKLSQLRYFQAVCKYKSITKATEQLHITQPSVSNAIKELEIEFNINLFNRSNNSMTLTSEGQVLLAHANEILEKVDLAEKNLKSLNSAKLILRIGIPSAIGSVLFPSIFTGFKEKHPEVQFNIHEFDSFHALTLIDAGVMDVALTVTNKITRQGLQIQNLKSTEMCLYTSAENPLAQLPIIPLAKLEYEPLILLRETTYQYQAVMEFFRQSNFSPNVIHQSSHLNIIRKFLEEGLASSIIMEGLLPLGLRIVTVPLDKTVIVNVGIVWKKGVLLTPILFDFINYVTTNFSNHPFPQ